MLQILRKHLFATNIAAIFFITIVRLVSVIESKMCNCPNCHPENLCEDCSTRTDAPEPQNSVKKSLKSLVAAMRRKTTPSFGFGEGYFNIFIEEKERNTTTTTQRA